MHITFLNATTNMIPVTKMVKPPTNEKKANIIKALRMWLFPT